MVSDEEKAARRRRQGHILMALLSVAFLALAGRLGQMQIQNGRRYRAMEVGERIRIVHLPAPRGKILDRNGVPLATERPSFTASLTYTAHPPTAGEVALLERILHIPAAAIAAAEKRLRVGVPYTPVRLKSGLSTTEVTQLDELRARLPGVVVLVEPTRYYPNRVGNTPVPNLASQVLGYIAKGASSLNVVGRAGVEASYNGPLKLPGLGGKRILGLAGVDGREQVEVDALGHPVSYVGGQPPTPGNNVVLTLDAKLEAVAQTDLLKNMHRLRTTRFYDGGPFPAVQAAAVAIDPRNGQILALASVPGFNPNDFARAAYAVPGTQAWKTWQRQWATLSNPKTPGHPLVDHALSDLSAPGSTFKPITSLAALSAGVITPTEPVACPPYLQVGNIRMHNWFHVFSITNLYQALAKSCDTYFYHVGALTGISRIAAMARSFGLGQPTGLHALQGENPGYVAAPGTQTALGYKRPWYVSDTMNAAIGQGFNAFNPLEVANYVATLANGGTRYRPYLVRRIVSPSGKVLWRNRPQVLGRVQVPAADFAAVRQGMIDVTEYHANWVNVYEPWGTAWAAFQGWRAQSKKYTGHVIQVAAKTGTAQQTGLPANNSWFICYAPANHPTIAIAIYVREGDEGLLGGAPVARDMLGAYFGVPGTVLAQKPW